MVGLTMHCKHKTKSPPARNCKRHTVHSIASPGWYPSLGGSPVPGRGYPSAKGYPSPRWGRVPQSLSQLGSCSGVSPMVVIKVPPIKDMEPEVGRDLRPETMLPPPQKDIGYQRLQRNLGPEGRVPALRPRVLTDTLL